MVHQLCACLCPFVAGKRRQRSEKTHFFLDGFQAVQITRMLLDMKHLSFHVTEGQQLILLVVDAEDKDPPMTQHGHVLDVFPVLSLQ